MNNKFGKIVKRKVLDTGVEVIEYYNEKENKTFFDVKAPKNKRYKV